MSSTNKKHKLLIIVFTFYFILGCACSSIKPQNDIILTPTSTNLTWSVELIKWEIADDLNASQAVIQYNGDTTQIQYHEMPSEGKTFLLVKLAVNKQKPGQSTFKWQNLYILDDKGRIIVTGKQTGRAHV